jgi:GNAT superfamily N-acetyltransferase
MTRVTISDVLKDGSQGIKVLFTDQVRKGTASDGLSDVTVTSQVVRWSATDDDGWSEIAWTNVDENSADQVILQQIEHFSSIDKAFVWRVFEDDLPHDLPSRLELAGFTHGGTSQLMIARVGDLTLDADVPDGVSLVGNSDERGIGRLIEVHEKVFESDQSDLRRRLLAQRTIFPRMNELVVAMVNGEPVSASRVQFFPDTDFAGLWGGGTVPSWRGKGLYRAMVAHRARVAAERGYTYLYVVASDQSRPILEHLSFASFGPVATFNWRPPVLSR